MNEKKKIILIIIAILIIGISVKAYKYYFMPINPNKIIVKDTSQVEQNATTQKKITFETPKIVIHIAGAVHHPGVYKVETGKRTIDIINTSGGGFLPEADIDRVNLAQIPKDGKRINVPFIKDSKKRQTAAPKPPEEKEKRKQNTAPININTADLKTLETLSRIGPKTALKIIQYRNKNGPFNTIEDLKKIKGIGPKTLEINRERIKI